MKGWIPASAFGLAAAFGYAVWQKWELKQFGVTHYEIVTDQLKKRRRAVMLADLHGFFYGEGNGRLLAAVERQRPDVILIAGDLVVSRDTETYRRALTTLGGLTKLAPVYYGMGNHESRALRRGLAVTKEFERYLQKAEELGVRILANRSCRVRLGEDVLRISGLELDLSYYGRGKQKPMPEKCIEESLGSASEEELQLLLAHNPAYAENYAAWGADVTFCGHNHGGLVRIPGAGGIITPQLRLFPKYGEGMHRIRGKYVITSRGLGTHTFHIRVFNRAELVCLTLMPDAGK